MILPLPLFFTCKISVSKQEQRRTTLELIVREKKCVSKLQIHHSEMSRDQMLWESWESSIHHPVKTLRHLTFLKWGILCFKVAFTPFSQSWT